MMQLNNKEGSLRQERCEKMRLSETVNDRMYKLSVNKLKSSCKYIKYL